MGIIPGKLISGISFQLFDKMCMALGGRVAESLVFNRVTTGKNFGKTCKPVVKYFQ